MNHIVLGTDDFRAIRHDSGIHRDCSGAALMGRRALHILVLPPRATARSKGVTHPVMVVTLDRLVPARTLHGGRPLPPLLAQRQNSGTGRLEATRCGELQDYRLKVSGLVENPVELSLDDLRTLGIEENVTMHHCIQGWSGIAQWGGVPMRKLIEHVKPLLRRRAVAFYSFGGSLYGDLYYDTQSIFNALKPQCLLALSMNGAPLPARVWRAPASARRKPAWLQDGEVDRAHRVCRLGENPWRRGRRGQRR